ncbi:MAG: SLC13 family permease [Bacteroidaceae bacterium]|nr:SLC13 family permease [Bacteroidaceae bacterium]
MFDTFVLGLNLAAWITIVAVICMFLTLIFTKLREDVVFLGVIAVLLISGVLDTKEALGGFSSNSVVVVGVLFAVLAGLTNTGVLQWISRYMLGTPKGYSSAVVRLMAPVALLSSVLSNTTVVALFVNIVKVWSKKLKIAPSKLLIPLSYASCLGGICTLIGTPPNLIISGLYASETGIQMNIFTTTIPGLACLVVGILTVLAFQRLLPVRQSVEDSFKETSEYTAELLVPADYKHIGMTVEEAGLVNVDGGSLIEIVRFDREIISPVPADEYLMGGDRLVFAGQVDKILELKKTHGLVNADHPVFSINEVDKKRKLRLAYVMRDCELIGLRMSETTIEHDHQLSLVAVARHGERIIQSPRDIEIRMGDSLLLECAPRTKDVAKVRGLQFFHNPEVMTEFGMKTFVSTLIMIGMIVLSSLEIMPLLQSAILAAFAMMVFHCCTPEQAMKAVNWNILMIFAGSVVIGTAIQKTGVAEAFANGLMSLCGQDSPLLVMAVMSLAGTFLTEFISNTAAAAIFYPIVYQAAVSMGVNPMPFLVSLMIAVSCSFATPIGSPTHMLVYGPGGYRFSDFMKIGLFMNLIILAVNLIVVNLLYPI